MKMILTLGLLLFFAVTSYSGGANKEIFCIAKAIDSLSVIVKNEAINYKNTGNYSEEDLVQEFVKSNKSFQLLVESYKEIYNVLKNQERLYTKYKIDREVLESFINHEKMLIDLNLVAFISYIESGRLEILTIIK